MCFRCLYGFVLVCAKVFVCIGCGIAFGGRTLTWSADRIYSCTSIWFVPVYGISQTFRLYWSWDSTGGSTLTSDVVRRSRQRDPCEKACHVCCHCRSAYPQLAFCLACSQFQSAWAAQVLGACVLICVFVNVCVLISVFAFVCVCVYACACMCMCACVSNLSIGRFR